jgi:hypothetical protein
VRGRARGGGRGGGGGRRTAPPRARHGRGRGRGRRGAGPRHAGSERAGRDAATPGPPRSQVTPAKYMEAIEAIQPEIFVGLADEARRTAARGRRRQPGLLAQGGAKAAAAAAAVAADYCCRGKKCGSSHGHDMPPDAAKRPSLSETPLPCPAPCQVLGDAARKRVVASVDRTTKWLDECLERLAAMQQRWQAAAAAAAGGAPAAAEAGASGRAEAGAAEAKDGEEQPAKRQRREGGAHSGSRGSSGERGGADGGDAELPPGAPLILAPVVGGSLPEERARSAKAAASKPVAGALWGRRHNGAA